MRTLFCLVFLMFGMVAEHPIPTEVEATVADIDDQILELERQKRGYEMQALRHEDQAERLQFDQDAYLEARRHLQLAEENRKMMAKIQAEIDRLKEKRLELLRQNGNNRFPPEGGNGLEDL